MNPGRTTFSHSGIRDALLALGLSFSTALMTRAIFSSFEAICSIVSSDVCVSPCRTSFGTSGESFVEIKDPNAWKDKDGPWNLQSLQRRCLTPFAMWSEQRL